MGWPGRAAVVVLGDGKVVDEGWFQGASAFFFQFFNFSCLAAHNVYVVFANVNMKNVVKCKLMK